MYSVKVIGLLFYAELLLISVRANASSQNEESLSSSSSSSNNNNNNSTSVAEERRDVHVKKPPRKRGTFGLSYGGSLGHGYPLHLPNHLKSFGHFKKDITPTFIEKYVAVPVHVKVPVDRPVPVPKLFPVTIEKAVPVPVKVIKKVPFPVKVPVDRPVYKPYPVYVERSVDKPIPVPVRVPVDRPFPVYVALEKPTTTTTTTTTEKPMMAMMAMPASGLKWLPEKNFALPAGKSLSWFDKPDSSGLLKLVPQFSGTSEDFDNEKLVASFLEVPESGAESEVSWPEGSQVELEIKK